MTSTFSINRLALLAVLKIAKTIAATSKYIPMLEAVELRAEGTAFILHATDLETHYLTTLKTESAFQGEAVTAVIRTKPLYDAVKNAEGTQITLAFDPDAVTLTVTDETQRATLLNFLSEDAEYPLLPVAGGEVAATLPLERLQGVLRCAAVSIGASNVRHAYDTAQLEFKEGSLQAVGTDGRRLSVAKVSAVVTSEVTCCLPTLTVKVLEMIQGAGDVQVFAADGQMAFEVGANKVIAKLSEKSFPWWEGLVPTEHQSMATVPRQQLAKVLTQVARLSKRSDDARCDFTFSAGSVVLQSGTDGRDGAGSLTARVPADYQGESLQIGLNPALVRDFLAVTGEESVEIRLQGAERPVMLCPAGFLASNKFIVAPVRL